jgi:hypothetical protein
VVPLWADVINGVAASIVRVCAVATAVNDKHAKTRMQFMTASGQ